MSKIRIRRGTEAQWSAVNPVLSDGELGWNKTANKLKIGNGITAWNDLPYLTSEQSATIGVKVEDEGTTVLSSATSLNFVGTGVNVTDASGGEVTVTINAGDGSGDLISANNLTDVSNPATALANLGGQPLDSDLTAISQLSTSVFGRALLTLANAAALRTAAELGSAALSSTSAFDAAGTASAALAAHTGAADPHPTYTTSVELTAALAAYQPLDSDLTAIAGLSTTIYGRTLLELANNAAMLGVLGTGTPSGTTYLRGDGRWETPAGGGGGGGDLLAANNLSELTATAATARTNLGLGSASTQNAGAFEAAGAVAAHASAPDPHPAYTTAAELSSALSPYLTTSTASSSYQPLDTDLTSIAATPNTVFGRGFLALVDAPEARTKLGLGTAATQNTAAFEAAGSITTALAAHTGAADPHPTYTTAAELSAAITAHEALGDPHPTYTTSAELTSALSPYLTSSTAASSYQPLDTDLTSLAATPNTIYGRDFLTLTDASGARTKLGLGTAATQGIAAFEAAGAVAAHAAAGDPHPTYTTAAELTSALSPYLTSATAASSYQPLDTDLTSIAATPNTVYGRGFLALTDATGARTKLGLGTAATQNTGAFETAGAVASAISTHESAVDPHPTYTTAAELSSALSAYLTSATASSTYQLADSDLTEIAALTTTAFGRAFLTLADDVALRTYLGSGAQSVNTFLRGDGTWESPVSGPGSAFYLESNFPTTFNIVLASRTAALNPGSGSTVVASFRAPYPITVQEIQSTLETATASGSFLIDVKRNGTSILSTALPIAQTAFIGSTNTFVGSSTSIAISKGDLVQFFITQSDATARGPQIWLIGVRNLNEIAPIMTVAPTTGRTSGNITLTWVAPSNAPVTGYKIERATDSGFTAGLTTVVANTGTTDVFRTISGIVSPTMTKGTAYWFRISGINNVAPSGGTSMATATSTVYATVPDQVTGVITATADNAQVRVAFTPLTNSAPTNGGSTVTSYKLFGRQFNTGNWLATNAAGPSSPLVVSQINGVNLVNGNAYEFAVTAVNDLGDSVQSATSGSVTPTPSGGSLIAPTIIYAGLFDQTGSIEFTASGQSVSATGYQWRASQSVGIGATDWNTLTLDTGGSPNPLTSPNYVIAAWITGVGVHALQGRSTDGTNFSAWSTSFGMDVYES